MMDLTTHPWRITVTNFFKQVDGEYAPLTDNEIKTYPLVKFLKETFYKLPNGELVRSARVTTDYPAMTDAFTTELVNVK
ncbi:hypothetical protein D3C76_37050 [compost metagenome]